MAQCPSVTVEIMGGLGNQLFQVFTLLAYGLDTDRQVILDQQPIAAGHRKRTYWQNLLRPLASRLRPIPPAQQRRVYAEPTFQYSPLPLNLTNPHVKLQGYFQSPLYFESHKPTICRLLKIKETQHLLQARTHYPYATTVAMHFRVGDYAHQQHNHPVLPLQYYTKALTAALATAKVNNKANDKAKDDALITVLYFYEPADQRHVQALIQALQQQFSTAATGQCPPAATTGQCPPAATTGQCPPAVQFVPIDHKFSDWEQLIIMSLCQRGQIMANSTFSWWGAYLQPEQQGQVFYPRTWFGPALAGNNTKYLFPPEWQGVG